MKRRLPKSLRKFIRREKARIRREVSDGQEREKLISELYSETKKEFYPQEKKKDDRKEEPQTKKEKIEKKEKLKGEKKDKKEGKDKKEKAG